jgi:uncharacterized protein DUF5916
MRHGRFVLLCLLTALAAAAPRVSAQTALSGPPITITRASGRITIDGDLSDEGWRHATRVTKWYETNPGDNSEPAVGNAGYLTYDDDYFYAGFEFADPDPRSIRAPYSDRDNVPPYTDYGGVVLDTRNDGKSAVILVANPHGIQYDSISDDTSGEDSSPDFFWESATRITDRGWTLEMRIPFSSLRYRNVDPQTWGVMLYRNYPRAFRYQFFSTVLPRGGNCFICRANTLHGLAHLPSGGHIVAAPYVSAGDTAHPRGDLGTALRRDPITSQAGIDVKWTPTADNAVDLTVKPDFSQVESDTAQISANERFALFFPEKRPFFLEGVNLFSTPIQAIYTRTITAPRWGARMTGKEAGIGYTVLVADDAGGGSAIIPGPNDSTLVSEDFGATVFVARLKKDVGRSFVSMVLTDREGHDGNGRNLVAGPDVQWRPTASDSITAQWLISRTTTPNRPDVAAEWTGQRLASQAGTIQWAHNTTHYDAFGMYKDVGAGFRADTGFVPQVDDRDVNGSTGWTFRPTGLVSRLRTFVSLDRQADHAGVLISRNAEQGVGMDTRWNGFMQFRYIDDRIRAGDRAIGRRQFGYVVQISPSRRISQISLDGTLGEQIDFENARAGHGSTVNLSASLHPTSHLEFAVIENQEWLNVDDPAGRRQRLFVARVSRVKSTYTFTARSFARLIGQYVSTDRDAALFVSPVAPRDGTFSGSALFAYKLNWQSVMFVGYGDDREVSDQNRLEPADRQFFVKLSYAFQR